MLPLCMTVLLVVSSKCLSHMLFTRYSRVTTDQGHSTSIYPHDTTHHNRFTALFRGPPGSTGAEENLPTVEQYSCLAVTMAESGVVFVDE